VVGFQKIDASIGDGGEVKDDDDDDGRGGVSDSALS